jgi:hypothetical protein
MSSPITARLPPDLAAALATYCVDAGISRTTVLVSALREYLATHKPRPTAYQLAMQVLAEYGDEPGLPAVQARDAKRILRDRLRQRSRGR